VHAFAFEADYDPAAFCSKAFELEWPPKSGRVRSFPEVDRLGWFAFGPALEKIIAYQKPFLTELKDRLDASGALAT
jgi:predicted NUDIX family NTP pyrophosphohydrolase